METEHPRPTAAIQLFIITVGLASGLIQVVLIRQLLIVASGSELSVGLILGIWLLSGAAGSWWGGRQASRDDDISLTVHRAPVLAGISTSIAVAAVCLIRLSPELFGRLPEPFFVMHGEMFGLLHVAALSVASVAPVAFGAEAQFGTGLSIYTALKPGPSPVARSYAVDSIGHLIGGGAAAYVLTLWLDPITATVIAGGLAIVAGMAVGITVKDAPGILLRRLIVPIGAIALVLALSPILNRATVAQRWEGYDLVATVNTLQSNIVIAEHGKSGRVFFINGQPSGYTETMPETHMLVHFTMLQHPDPQRVLLVGGRATGALDELAGYSPERIDYFEIDPGLVDIYAEYRAAAEKKLHANVRIHRRDLRAYLRSSEPAERSWDVAIMATPPPLTAVVNRFYTRECIRQIASASGDIVFGFRMPGTQTYYSSDLLKLDSCILHTARGGVRSMAIMPGYSLFAAIGANTGYMSEKSEVMLDRLDRRGVEAPYWESVIFDHLDPMNVDHVRNALSRMRNPATNTDLRPIAYYLNQIYALRQLDPAGARVLALLETVSLSRMLQWLAAGLLAVLLVLALLRRAGSVAVPAAIGGTGFVAMVLQLALIYGFQIQVGHIYSLIGVLTGAFMVGLAAGGLFAGRMLESVGAEGALKRLMVALVALAAVSLALPRMITGATALSSALPIWVLAGGFFALSLLIGILVGVQFPLATVAEEHRGHRGAAAAAMYAADLLGASVGAVVAGAVLVPLYGIGGSSLLCAMVGCILLAGCALKASGR